LRNRVGLHYLHMCNHIVFQDKIGKVISVRGHPPIPVLSYFISCMGSIHRALVGPVFTYCTLKLLYKSIDYIDDGFLIGD
jgi:hypothetical protein